MADRSGEGVAANNLKLYSYWNGSSSFRVRIALNLKGIKYEYKAVDLLKGEQSDPEFLKLNPIGFVPVLVDGDVVIADSFAIVMKEFPVLAGLHQTYNEIPAFREALPENQPDAVH